MEDRSIWLPPGLEGGRLEPDDRSSQRGALGNGGARRQNPVAQGKGADSQGADEPKRGRAEGQPGRPRKQGGEGRRGEPAASRAPEAKPAASRAPEAKPDVREEESRRQPQPEQHRPSGVDAMGQDKHREVVGQRYGASRGRQLLYYGGFVAFVVAAYIGLKAATDELDKAPAHDPDQAPWSKPGAPQGPLGGFEPSRPGQRSPTDFQ